MKVEVVRRLGLKEWMSLREQRLRERRLVKLVLLLRMCGGGLRVVGRFCNRDWKCRGKRMEADAAMSSRVRKWDTGEVVNECVYSGLLRRCREPAL